jgi:RNA polymerase sigma-70 factor, ECF subfamily
VTEHSQREFEHLWERHHRRVLAYALRRADRATAEDVVSETFLTAWRRRAEQPVYELAWLLAVARNLLANQARGERRRDALAHALLGQASATHLGPDAVDSDVLRALAALDESDREALILVAWDGLTPAEAARVVGCSAAAFRARQLRARRRLRRLLNKQASPNSFQLEPESPA